MGAFYSSGSRPNQSAQSWALARLASVILKHGAYKVDRHVLIENGCDNIKPPPQKGAGKKRKGKGKIHSKRKRKGKIQSKRKRKRKIQSQRKRKHEGKSKTIISCCQINDKNEDKYKVCERPSDGSLFTLPRKYNRTSCKSQRGFTMRSSCAPFNLC